MRFLPGNAQHIGARHSQQDSFGFSDPSNEAFLAHGGFLAIVCDGMGGMEFGDEASRTAVRAFLDAYARKTEEETIPAALERSTREANAQVVELAKRLGMKDGVGTTLVAAALLDRSLYYVSVGDSALFLCAPGEYRMLNRPHVFANVLDAAVARGTMSREDAQTHPERESLTSYIGGEKLEEIDRNLEPYILHDGDTVMLATDGMFKTLSPEEIRACLAGNPQSWPDVLVTQTLAHKREYQDNVTVISVTATDELAATTIAPTLGATPVMAPTAPPSAMPAVPPPAIAASKPALEWPSGEHAAVSTAPRPGSLWLAVVLLVLALAGAAGWWYSKHERATPEPAKREDLPALRGEPAGATGVDPQGKQPADPSQDQAPPNPDGSSPPQAVDPSAPPGAIPEALPATRKPDGKQ